MRRVRRILLGMEYFKNGLYGGPEAQHRKKFSCVGLKFCFAGCTIELPLQDRLTQLLDPQSENS